jgi:hypothetical protein
MVIVFYTVFFTICKLFKGERAGYMNEMSRMQWLYIRRFLYLYFNPIEAETWLFIPPALTYGAYIFGSVCLLDETAATYVCK